MPRRSLSLIILLQLISSVVFADELRKDVRYLASEATAGRAVGTEGHDRARDYIVDRMKQAGLQPAGTDGWLVPVNLVRESTPTEMTLRVGERVLAADREYQAADFTDEVTLSGTPLFAGYGIQATTYGWNDYAGLDVTGRVVFVLTGGPPRLLEAVSDYDRYLLTDASKAAVALSRGAQAIVFVNDPRGHGDSADQREDRLASIRPTFALEGIGAAHLTSAAADTVLSEAGLDLEQYQRTLDASGPQSVELPLEVRGHLELRRDVVTAHNVVGKLAGKSSGPPLVLGAHYDHLGLGHPASDWDGGEALHPGADDNASGVAVMLAVARRLREADVDRPVYFAALTGEENGLRGSRRLARVLMDREQPSGVYINMDMVGRLGVEPIVTYGLDDAGPLGTVVRNAALGFDLAVEERPLDAALSDHIAFADLGWTAIGLSTGRHADYHRPTDTIDKLDWAGMRRFARFVAEVILAAR